MRIILFRKKASETKETFSKRVLARLSKWTLLLLLSTVTASAQLTSVNETGLTRRGARESWAKINANNAWLIQTFQSRFNIAPIYANSNFTVSATQVANMRMTNTVFAVDTTASNITLTLPPYFENVFSALNLGTNWLTLQSAGGNKFLLAPMDGSILYSDTLVNKYALKVHTLFHVNATNVVVQSEFKPLPNVVYLVTNNMIWPEAGEGAAQTNISVAGVTNAGTAAYSNASAFYLASNPGAYVTASSAQDATNGLYAVVQPLDAELTAWSAIAPSTKQAASANLDAWSAIATATKEPAITAGTTAQYWRGDKSWQTLPAGGGYATKLQMTTNFVNAHGVANTLTNITELSFAVVSGTTYKFRALVYFTTAATTTGSRWCITGPAMTACGVRSEYTLTATTTTRNAMLQGVNLPAAANLTSAAGVNMAEITGIFRPSANGTVSLAFASEVLSSAVTAQAGSTLEYW
jgi:hypothetical protein